MYVTYYKYYAVCIQRFNLHLVQRLRLVDDTDCHSRASYFSYTVVSVVGGQCRVLLLDATPSIVHWRCLRINNIKRC